uniref:RNA helicase n=1 Tax=Erythrolobus australicus TaxID=1077150 RepID=A0A7S1XHV4_9RHOD
MRARTVRRRRCARAQAAVDGARAAKEEALRGGRGDARDAEARSFEDVCGGALQRWIVERLRELGFERPTEVQSAAFEVVLGEARADAVVHAQTGSGKTLAYLVPLLNTIDLSRSALQALIVVPTQELGVQVYRLARRIAAGFAATPGAKAEMVREAGQGAAGSADSSDGDDDASFEEALGLSAEDAENGDETHEVKMGSTYYVLPLFDQGDLRRQKLQIRHAGPRILVATPRRLVEVAQSGRLQLHTLRFLVVDEFDASLEDADTTRALQSVLMASTVSSALEKQIAGTLVTDATASAASGLQQSETEVAQRGDGVAAAVAQMRRAQRQTMLVSATVPQHRHFLKQCVAERWTNESVQHIYLSADTPVPARLRHFYVVCERKKKLAALHAVISTSHPAAALVFVHRSRDVVKIAASLERKLASAAAERDIPGSIVAHLSENMSAAERRANLLAFREGSSAVMVSTSVAARGLDIPQISHVIHVDLPDSAQEYLHRSGRAGRLGRVGDVVSLCDQGELFVVDRFANQLGVEFIEATTKALKRWRQSREEEEEEQEA